MLSEVSQTQKGKDCVVHLQELLSIVKFVEAERDMVVNRGLRGGEVGSLLAGDKVFLGKVRKSGGGVVGTVTRRWACAGCHWIGHSKRGKQ